MTGLLLAAGEGLGAGEVVIGGPHDPGAAGDEINFELFPLAPISVSV